MSVHATANARTVESASISCCGPSRVIHTQTLYQQQDEETDSDISELQEKINKALNELPEKCRLVFEMSRFKNMKYKDIAEELEVSVKTVEAHMSKALKSLKAHLKDIVYFLILIFLT